MGSSELLAPALGCCALPQGGGCVRARGIRYSRWDGAQASGALPAPHHMCSQLGVGWVTASCSGEESSQLWVEGETSTPVPTPINSQQIVHSSGAGNKWAGRQG